MKLRFLLILPLLSTFTSAATLATTNLTDDGYDVVTYNTWKGQSFTLTPSAHPGNILSVTLQLEVITPNSNLAVFIVGRESGSGVPDLAQNFARLDQTSTVSGTLPQPVTFTLNSAASANPIEPGNTYWLVVGMTAPDLEEDNPSGLIRWHYAGTQGQDSGAEPGWSVGTRTAESGTAGQNWSASVQTPYLFEMTAAIVPEPATASLILPAALLAFRRRRQ